MTYPTSPLGSQGLPTIAPLVATLVLLAGFNAPCLGASVVAWGLNRYGAGNVPANLGPVIAISAGTDHSVALLEDGTVVAWGSNLDGETAFGRAPGPYCAVEGGDWVTFALSPSGTLTPWGNAKFGASGIPAEATDLVAVDCGVQHVLGLKRDGTVVAWGENWRGQCDVPADLTGVIQVAGGYGYSLALRANGEVVAWGELPQPRPEIHQVVDLAAGWLHSLFLTAEGTVLAWGPDDLRRAVGAWEEIVAIEAGNFFSLALRRDGTVVQWPLAGEGIPFPEGLSRVTAIAAHGFTALALVDEPARQPSGLTAHRSQLGVSLTWPTVRGRRYSLEYTDEVSPSAWRVAARRYGTDEPITRLDLDASPLRLFRVHE